MSLHPSFRDEGAHEWPQDDLRTAVHLWRIELDEPPPGEVPVLAEVLSPDERLRADRFHFERDRRRFVVGRAALRGLLARYLETEAGQVAFEYGAAGKPRLVDVAESELAFNVSHAGSLAIVGVTRSGDVGVDVERRRDLADWRAMARSALPVDVVAALERQPEAEQPAAFLQAWTREEALLKAVGTGLGGERTGVLELRVHSFRVAPDFVLSVAASQDVSAFTYRCWHYPYFLNSQPATAGQHLRCAHLAPQSVSHL